jgi:hypothetical protein
VVLENLRARGQEWRASSIPEDLRPYRVTSLAVNVSGSEFSLHWIGSTSLLYNPVCSGSVEGTGQGSRIHARFKRRLGVVYAILLMIPLAFLQVEGEHSAFRWLILAAWLFIFGAIATGSTHKRPLRARLIDVLTAATQQRGAMGSPFTSTLSTNGP